MSEQKKKKSSMKRVILPTTACLLAAALAVGGTYAYLTDSEEHTNVFTLGGNVGGELTETKWPGDNTERVKNIVGNEEIAKNPVITNTGTSPAIAFIRITVPTANVTEVADDGTRLGSRDYENGQTQHPDGRSYSGNDFRTEDGNYNPANNDYVKGTQYNGGTAAGKTREGQANPRRTMQDLFYMKQDENAQSDHNNHFDNSWIELFSEEDQDVQMDNGTKANATTTNSGKVQNRSQSQTAKNFGSQANAQGERIDLDGETNKGDDLNNSGLNADDEKYGTRSYVFAYYRPIAGTDDAGNNDVGAHAHSAAWKGADGGVYYNPQDNNDHKTTAIFDKVQLKNFMEDEVAPGMAQEMRVESYLIQARDVLNGAASGAKTGENDQSNGGAGSTIGAAGQADGVGDYTDLMTRENLERIYDVFMRQDGLTDAVYNATTKQFDHNTHNATIGGSTNEADKHGRWTLGDQQSIDNKNNAGAGQQIEEETAENKATYSVDTGLTKIVRTVYRQAQDKYKANVEKYNSLRAAAIKHRDDHTHDDTPADNTNDSVHDTHNQMNTTKGSGDMTSEANKN